MEKSRPRDRPDIERIERIIFHHQNEARTEVDAALGHLGSHGLIQQDVETCLRALEGAGGDSSLGCEERESSGSDGTIQFLRNRGVLYTETYKATDVDEHSCEAKDAGERFVSYGGSVLVEGKEADARLRLGDSEVIDLTSLSCITLATLSSRPPSPHPFAQARAFLNLNFHSPSPPPHSIVAMHMDPPRRTSAVCMIAIDRA